MKAQIASSVSFGFTATSLCVRKREVQSEDAGHASIPMADHSLFSLLKRELTYETVQLLLSSVLDNRERGLAACLRK